MSVASAPVADRALGAVVVLVLVLLSSGNPIYVYPELPELVLLPVALVLLIALGTLGAFRVENRDLAVFAILVALIAVHLVTVPGATATSGAGFLVRLFIGFAVFRLVADVPRRLVEVMAVLSALALLVFAVDQMLLAAGVDVTRALGAVSVVDDTSGHLFTPFHNFPREIDRHRNAGIFWEPGALSGYALFGLVLLAFLPERLAPRRTMTITVVLTLAVISAQATAGYIVLPLVLLLLSLRLSSARGSGFVALALAAVLPVLFAAAMVAYELPFMRDKIESQIQSVQLAENQWELTRLGTLISDIADIRERPLVGWGANSAVRPSQLALNEATRGAQGNGFTSWTVRFGTVGLLLFLITLAAGLRRYGRTSRAEAWFAVGIVCLLLQGEAFLNYPLFLGLMFMSAGPAARRYWVVPAAAPSSVDGHEVGSRIH
jgi:hypothetical protein